VLVYTVHGDYGHVQAALSLGVQGYLGKDKNQAELETALEALLNGKIYIDRDISIKLVDQHDRHAQLTPREQEVYNAVKAGKDNAEIAKLLHINKRTVENYLSLLYDKLGVSERSDL
jgi:DNA-binding NarL/FixJ family response regulator